jgi:Fe-S cluster biogenesis protein NfuA
MNPELNARLHRIEKLVAEIRSPAGRDARAAALELVETLMAFHAAGIDRMMEIASESGETGWRMINTFGRDPLVANMLLLHGMHPLDLETRVQDALEKVRPNLRAHGGNVELVEIRGGVVRLRLVGSCHGCPSSSETFRSTLEAAIYEGAPDVASVQCETTSELTGVHNAA